MFFKRVHISHVFSTQQQHTVQLDSFTNAGKLNNWGLKSGWNYAAFKYWGNFSTRSVPNWSEPRHDAALRNRSKTLPTNAWCLLQVRGYLCTYFIGKMSMSSSQARVVSVCDIPPVATCVHSSMSLACDCVRGGALSSCAHAQTHSMGCLAPRSNAPGMSSNIIWSLQLHGILWF